MKVRLLAGSSLGKITHIERSQLSMLLADLGLLDIIPDEVVQKTLVPEWMLGRSSVTGRPMIQHCEGGVTRFYDGAPANAKTAFKVWRWSPQYQSKVLEGAEPPQPLLDLYEKAFNAAGGEDVLLWRSVPE